MASIKNSAVFDYLCDLIKSEQDYSRNHKNKKRNTEYKWKFEKDYQSLRSNLKGDDEQYMFTGTRYLLNQIIRQYIPREDNYFISEKALELWKKLSNKSVWGYVYTNQITYEGRQTITLKKYTGNSNTPTSITLRYQDKFKFNDFFTDEHIIDISSVIEVLVNLKDPAPADVKKILDQIEIARILKEEDKMLPVRHHRLKDVKYKEMDSQFVKDNVYKGIKLIPMSKTKSV